MAKPSPNYSGDPLLVAIGQAIRVARKDKGISQEALALATELDRSYVGGIERGEHNLGLISLKKVSDELGLNLSELFKLAGY
jgi:transcriptional regulator with XRE-family HTH domain